MMKRVGDVVGGCRMKRVGKMWMWLKGGWRLGDEECWGCGQRGLVVDKVWMWLEGGWRLLDEEGWGYECLQLQFGRATVFELVRRQFEQNELRVHI